MTHPFFTYTREILSWRLGDPAPVGPASGVPGPDRTDARVRRILRAAPGRPAVFLLGLGTGRLASALAAALPPATALTVLSLVPATARHLWDAGSLAWITPEGPRQLLADSSPQALFCLLAMAGPSPGEALVTVNPEDTSPDEREALVRLRRLLDETSPLVLPAGAAPAGPGLTLAVLARPDEPDLPGFFEACRGLASQAVVLWDGPDVPAAADGAASLGIPVRHLARPLGRDFAAQRNALLRACPPGWVLTLDPDERPGPGFGDLAARLAATPGVGAAYFPRITLYPDAGHAKAGHGLWPDLQLRLFSTAPPARARYVRPVHERLEGLAGRAALALGTPIFHHNRLLADDDAVQAKLARYDAAGGAPVHRLSRDYPSLPLSFFTPPAGKAPDGRVLLLPALW
uniref:Glycosyl transferase n=1 Tax=Desulfovibrio sp. U5L TaxID=596152 RepID=I2PXW9_9BACT